MCGSLISLEITSAWRINDLICFSCSVFVFLLCFRLSLSLFLSHTPARMPISYDTGFFSRRTNDEKRPGEGKNKQMGLAKVRQFLKLTEHQLQSRSFLIHLLR